jgi:hypothetical protein
LRSTVPFWLVVALAATSACLTSIEPDGNFQCDPSSGADCVDAGADAGADGGIDGGPPSGRPPTAVAGLDLWLSASSLSLSSGAPVTTWADVRDGGMSGSEFEAGSAPTFLVNEISGEPAVHFNSTNHSVLLLSSNLANASYTLVAVGAPSSNRLIFLGGGYAPDSGGLDTGAGDDFFGPSVTQVLLRGSGDQGLTMANPSINGAHIYSATVSADGGSVWVDGNLIGEGIVPPTSFDSIGSRSAGKQFSDGDVAEIVVFGQAVADSDRLAIESYFNGKYSLY